MTLRHGEIFAGIGAIGYGFEWAGIETVWRVEIDRQCQRVLRRHYPGALLLDDVRACSAHNLPPVDIISAGFPCTDLSVAGKRAGLSGTQSGLFYEAARIVDELRPTLFIWENVPGLLSLRGAFGAVLGTLGDIGYCGAWTTLDARYFAVAQRRQRVFGVFTPEHLGARRPAAILALATRRAWHPAPGRPAGARVAATITSGVGVTGNAPGRRREDDENLVMVSFVANTIGANAGRNQIEQTYIPTVGAIRGNHYADHAGDENRLTTFDWQSGGDVRLHCDSEHTSAIQRRQVPAVMTQGVRRLMPTEVERLFALPDHWTATGDDGRPISDSARYRMLGNSIVTTVPTWIGKRIVAMEEMTDAQT